jgi:protoporphyrinogen oxidase
MTTPSTAPITILGAGIAGLSASYHLGHERCVVFDKQPTYGGHTRSEQSFGFTFDHGPHVSFTKHDYVRELFERSTGGEQREFEVRTRNYFRGAWIDHPAQVHLWQVPEPLRSECYRELLNAAESSGEQSLPANYGVWLERAFGPTFAETFPRAYTRKYWTVEAEALSCDWLGSRVLRPNREQVELGMRPETRQAAHYITKVRYPTRGGFQSFLAELARGVRLEVGREVASIDLASRRLWFSDGTQHSFERLVSTLPLDSFISRCQKVPAAVREAVEALDCTQLLLVNVCAPHPAPLDGHWFYVYDEDLQPARIHVSERLSPNNALAGHTAVQAECYFSRHRQLTESPDRIAAEVAQQLAAMGFVDADVLQRGEAQVFWRWAPHANVVFTHERRDALEIAWRWLEQFGLIREGGDLAPAQDWNATDRQARGSLMFAGRFAQWKYFWTDDCVLRGRQLADDLAEVAARTERCGCS